MVVQRSLSITKHSHPVILLYNLQHPMRSAEADAIPGLFAKDRFGMLVIINIPKPGGGHRRFRNREKAVLNIFPFMMLYVF